MPAYEINENTNEHEDHPVRDVDPAASDSMIDQGAFLLDVRELDEWEAGHIKGATHIPLGDLDPELVPGDVPIVVVCRSGNRSSKAAAQLIKAGRDVVNLAGGMKAWADAGLPVITNSGGPGTI